MNAQDILVVAERYEEAIRRDGILRLKEKEAGLVVKALREYAALRRRRELGRMTAADQAKAEQNGDDGGASVE